MKIQLEDFVYLKNVEEPIENRKIEGAVKFTGKISTEGMKRKIVH